MFGVDVPLASQVKQRAALDQALAALGRDPSAVGILWQTPIVVADTERDAQAQRDRGFMLGHIVSLPGDLLAIVGLLVP